MIRIISIRIGDIQRLPPGANVSADKTADRLNTAAQSCYDVIGDQFKKL